MMLQTLEKICMVKGSIILYHESFLDFTGDREKANIKEIN